MRGHSSGHAKALLIAGLVESLVIGGGVALYLVTDNLWPIGAAAVTGGLIMIFTLLYARGHATPSPKQGSIVQDARGRR